VVASGGSESSVVKEQEVLHTKFIGKPTFIVTSAGTSINTEGSRRWLNIPTDSCESLNEMVQENKFDRYNKQKEPNVKLTEADLENI